MSAPLPEPEAEAQGFDAYEHGANAEDNPYEEGTRLAQAWEFGRQQAMLRYLEAA